MYVVGDESKARRAIVVASDIWGFKSGRHCQVCDLLATRLKAVVYLPDFFHGEPCSADKAPGTPAFGPWVKRWTTETVRADLQKLFDHLDGGARMLIPGARAGRPPTCIGVVGFCWGTFATVLAQSGPADVRAAALVHPSHRKIFEAVHGASEGQVT